MRYHLAALGGTFDRFHRGHQQLLNTALASAEQLVIGVTQNAYVAAKPFSQVIEPFDTRVANVQRAVQNAAAAYRATIVPLTDLYGPTLTDAAIDALVVSTQTKRGGDLINQARQAKGLPPLPIIEATMIHDETGDYLSSTQIRGGKVSRNGQAYRRLFARDTVFDDATLAALKAPQGEVIQPAALTPAFLQPFVTVTLVGDIITRYFLDQGLPFTAGIIDGVTQKQQPVPLPPGTIELAAANQPGQVSAAIAQSVMRILQDSALKQPIIKVNGEEDLLAFIPALIQPLQSLVLYGQLDQGIVMLKVDEPTKIKLARLIDVHFN